jgi:hypothetical protein
VHGQSKNEDEELCGLQQGSINGITVTAVIIKHWVRSVKII